jgi:N6-L-threonylcarbamoyladenine synthase
VMVAWAGVERLALGLIDDLSVTARARWPLDPSAKPALGAGVKA